MKKNILLTFTAALLGLNYFAVPAFAADIEKGKEKYGTLCASCHGMSGKGDGPVGMALPAGQKPADFTTVAFKFATDETKFKELLQKGGAAVGLNPLMPAQAGLTDEDVANLYAFVMTFKK